MNGLPSSIACGLTAATQIQGTNVSIGSDPSNSTDGQGGAYVGPPPAMPFRSLDPTGYVCLSHDTDPPLCLPPGTYQITADWVSRSKVSMRSPSRQVGEALERTGRTRPNPAIQDVRETPVVHTQITKIPLNRPMS